MGDYVGKKREEGVERTWMSSVGSVGVGEAVTARNREATERIVENCMVTDF
jgi:hypothetical protein